MSTTAFATEAQGLKFRKIAVQGAVSGLFFAQTLAWQEVVDAMIIHLLGVATDDPAFALWRAFLVTLFTSTLAWFILTVARRCEACSVAVVTIPVGKN